MQGFLSVNGIKHYESKMNLNWKPIIKSIQEVRPLMSRGPVMTSDFSWHALQQVQLDAWSISNPMEQTSLRCLLLSLISYMGSPCNCSDKGLLSLCGSLQEGSGRNLPICAVHRIRMASSTMAAGTSWMRRATAAMRMARTPRKRVSSCP